MSRTTVLLPALVGALVATGLGQSAHADWQEEAFDIIAVGAPGAAMQPSIATGIDWPTDDWCEIEPCALEEPVPVTRVAYIDTANNDALMLASRFGPPGEPWTIEMVFEANAQHPYLILDRDGKAVLSFLDKGAQFWQLKIARRTGAALGSTGQLDSIFVREIAVGEFDNPAPITMQYHGWNMSPTGAERGIHVVYSNPDAIMHSFLSEEGFWPGPEYEWDFRRYAIVQHQNPNTENWDGDFKASLGKWPDAAPLWTDLSTDGDDIFAYEALPAVAYQNDNITFTRAYREHPWDNPTAPPYDFTDLVELWPYAELRPSIDAVRDYSPAVVWSAPCPEAGNLLFTQSDPREPKTYGDWSQPQYAGSENACDAELSIVDRDNVPYIAFADPFSGEVGTTGRPDPSGPWYQEMIGEGAEPTSDYNTLTETQAVAFVEPSTGELRVVDGAWF